MVASILVQDGVNVWPLLMDPPAPTNYSAAHEVRAPPPDAVHAESN